jgi:hypothetical protein
MTSQVQVVNVLRCRVTNHLFTNKAPFVDPNNPDGMLNIGKRIRYHYAWKPDRAEAHRIKRLSKGYVKW